MSARGIGQGRQPALLCLLLVGLWAGARPATAEAQSWVDWARQIPAGPPARIENSLIYDSVSNRVVMFGGYDLNWNRLNDLWEYNTATRTWVDVTPASGVLPQRRSGHTMAFDPVRRTIVLFGGLNDAGTYLNDTWEWHTVARTWTNVTPAGSPAPRQGARLVYDEANARMILVGGVDLNQFFGQTWVWNLAARTWTQITPSVSSPTGRPFLGRTFPGAGYNPTPGRGVTVFGGIGFPAGGSTVVDFNDTWELRGNTWTDVTPAAGNPPGRGWTQLVHDASLGRMVMFAGFRVTSPASYGDTWAFDGVHWTEIVPESAGLGVRDSHGMVYDSARQRMVVFGGYLADVIELSANTWTRVLETVWPPPQDQHAMAYDSDRQKVFLYGGGSPESWELTPSTGAWTWYYVGGPDGRTGTGVVYEQARQRMLLFGGRRRVNGASTGTLNDTWAWNTTAHTWTNVTPGTSPSAREDHAMAYDAARDRVVLFGGRAAGGSALGDTWLWNGSSWANITGTANGPSARFGAAMSYDAIRGVLVLFGGDTGTTKLQDTWEFDGATGLWIQRFPSAPLPAARAFASLSRYDTATAGVVLFGGNGAALRNDAWIWNGTTWTATSSGGSMPSPRQHAGVVYDPASQRLLLYGGQDARGVSAELWAGTVTAAAGWPLAVSVTPSAGSGSAATLTALYRHGGGPSQIREVELIINVALSGPNGVFVQYLPATNTLRLRDDTSTGWKDGVVGSAGTLANNQVTIALASVTIATTSSDLALSVPMSFKNGFNGPKQIHMTATDVGGANPNGWLQKGAFFVSSGNSAPTMISVTPVSGSGASGVFTATYRDLNGVNDLQQAYFLINTGIDAGNAAYLYYVPATNTLYLRDAADTNWNASGTPGSGAQLSNGLVTVVLAQTSVVKTATDLVLSISLSFAPGFSGFKNVYLFGVDGAGAQPAQYQWLGTWGVHTPTPSNPPPTRLTPDDLTVYRPTNGMWHILTGGSAHAASDHVQWGLAGDVPLRADFDGDRRADVVVYRPTTGEWIWKTSSSGFASSSSLQWGLRGDVPVPADFDGDGKTDIGVYRPSDGTWSLRFSASGYALSGYRVHQWGLPGDQPIPADFDGDGRADVAVFRAGSGHWVILTSSSNFTSALSYQWGLPGDVPALGDFDGDRRTDLAVYRPSNGTWTIAFSAGGFASVQVYQWGLPGDLPITGDYDADGKTDLAVWRPAIGTWFLRFAANNFASASFKTFAWGQAGDVPQPTSSLAPRPTDLVAYRTSNGTWKGLTAASGWATVRSEQWGLSGDQPLRADFDGDRLPDLVVYRPSTGDWFVRLSGSDFANIVTYQWGLPGDVPMPADFDGDGRADLAVYRPSNGLWSIRFSSSSYSLASWAQYQWGLAGDQPQRADFDGDGRADLVVYRPSDRTWWIRTSTSGYNAGTPLQLQWGLAGDLPIPADFDGDGRTDLAVYRPSNGTWAISFSGTGFTTAATYQWGLGGDQPIVGDFDGDSRADLIVWRPSTGVWSIRFSTHAYNIGTWRAYNLGQTGDVGLPIR